MSSQDIAGRIEAVGLQIVPLQAAFQSTPETEGEKRDALRAAIVELKQARAKLFVELEAAKTAEAIDAVTAATNRP